MINLNRESGLETCYAGKENAIARQEESKTHNAMPIASLYFY